MTLGEQPVEQRGADVADVQQPGGARRETDDWGDWGDHAARLATRGRWRVEPGRLGLAAIPEETRRNGHQGHRARGRDFFFQEATDRCPGHAMIELFEEAPGKVNS